MSTTLYGTFTDAIGHAMWQGWDGHRTRTRVAAQPSGNFNKVQADFIAIDVNHTGPAFGQCVYLERQGGHLWAVGVIHDDLPLDADDKLHWSALTAGRRRLSSSTDTDIELRSLAITADPAGINISRLQSLPGDIRSIPDRSQWKQKPALIERAITYCERHRRDEPLVIAEPDGEPVTDRGLAVRSSYERPTGPVEYMQRPAGRILSVGGRPVRSH